MLRSIIQPSTLRWYIPTANLCLNRAETSAKFGQLTRHQLRGGEREEEEEHKTSQWGGNGRSEVKVRISGRRGLGVKSIRQRPRCRARPIAMFVVPFKNKN